MSDIFREVDEALQKEKAAKFWKEYGPVLVGAAIVMVASTAITTGYMHWSSSRNKEATSQIVAAANSADASTLQQTAKDLRGGHRAVALMNAASLQSEAGNFTDAAQTYLSVAKDRSAPDELSDLAAVLYARAAVLAAGVEQANYKEIIDVVLPVAKNKKSAFHAQARIEAAALYGGGLKDYSAALSLLEGLQDGNVPESLKEKAAALSQVYSLEQTPQGAAQE